MNREEFERNTVYSGKVMAWDDVECTNYKTGVTRWVTPPPKETEVPDLRSIALTVLIGFAYVILV